MISLSAVRLFVRVADFGSIASAARELRIAPSVASRQIAALERWFGTKLLLRTTRQVSLTQAGSTFLEWARSTDASLEELRDDLGAMQHRPSGIIRLSCNDYAATALLPPVLARFCHDYPEVRVQLTTSNDPAALLREGCELAMHAGRAPDVDVICRRVLSYRRRLCAAPAYLEHRGTPTIIADLAAHNCITHTHGERNSWSFLQGRGYRQSGYPALYRMRQLPIHHSLRDCRAWHRAAGRRYPDISDGAEPAGRGAAASPMRLRRRGTAGNLAAFPYQAPIVPNPVAGGLHRGASGAGWQRRSA